MVYDLMPSVDTGANQHQAAHDRDSANPGWNLAMFLERGMKAAHLHDAMLGGVADAPEYNDGAEDANQNSNNDQKLHLYSTHAGFAPAVRTTG